MPSPRPSASVDAPDPVLAGIPVLGYLPPDVRDLVIASFTPSEYKFGQVIVREGDPSDALYVLVTGRARMVKPSAPVWRVIPVTVVRDACRSTDLRSTDRKLRAR